MLARDNNKKKLIPYQMSFTFRSLFIFIIIHLSFIILVHYIFHDNIHISLFYSFLFSEEILPAMLPSNRNSRSIKYREKKQHQIYSLNTQLKQKIYWITLPPIWATIFLNNIFVFHSSWIFITFVLSCLRQWCPIFSDYSYLNIMDGNKR